MPTMNFDQMKSGLVSILMLVGMYLVGNKTFTSEQWTSITNNVMIAIPALIAAGGLLYKMFQHTDAKKIEAVVEMPQAQKAAAVATLPAKALVTATAALPGIEIQVAPSAPAGAQTVASDITVENVTKS